MVGGLVVAAVGYVVWKVHEAGALPNGIISTNGRIEAPQVDTSAAQALVAIFAISSPAVWLVAMSALNCEGSPFVRALR